MARDAYPRPDRPVVELHRHLDGNVRTATVLDLARRHGIALPADSVERLTPHVQITERTPSLLAFLSKFEWLQQVMADYDAVRRIVRENLEDAVAEGWVLRRGRTTVFCESEAFGASTGRLVAKSVLTYNVAPT